MILTALGGLEVSELEWHIPICFKGKWRHSIYFATWIFCFQSSIIFSEVIAKINYNSMFNLHLSVTPASSAHTRAWRDGPCSLRWSLPPPATWGQHFTMAIPEKMGVPESTALTAKAADPGGDRDTASGSLGLRAFLTALKIWRRSTMCQAHFITPASGCVACLHPLIWHSPS